jgi:FkbM family methyltransferase
VAEKQLENLVDFARKNLRKNVAIIFELGARDCSETLEFYKIFPNSHIYTFECNKNTLPICRKKTRNIKNITLIEKAVSNKNSIVKFFPINKELTKTTWEDGNQGASSLFKASGKYPVEDYVQDEITVNSTRLDSVIRKNGIESVDLLWMDIQGAELLALKGLGKEISKVKIIHTEVEFFEIYKDQPLFKDIKRFLNRKGYLLASFTNFGVYSGDAIFINQSEIKTLKIPLYKIKDLILYQKKKRFTQISLYYRKSAASLKTFRDNAKLKLNKLKFLRAIKFICHFKVENEPLISTKRAFAVIKLKFLDLVGKDKTLSGLEGKNTLIDVIIPVASKDAALLTTVVEGIKKNLKHNVDKVFIVSDTNKIVQSICKKNNFIFLNEDLIAGISKRKIRYFAHGIDRSGWLYQQFIKLSADKISKKKYVLVCDSDTVLCNPQRLIVEGKIIFNHSDEYNKPYFKSYKKITGHKYVYPLSYVSHYMMVDTSVLKLLKKHIESFNSCPWDEAILSKIDTSKLSAFSEYETYGNFYCSVKKASHSYWNNVNLAGKNIQKVKPIVTQQPKKIKSVSFHKHEKIN